MPRSRDYYALLGVSRGASQEEIRKAYREAVLRTHPDRVPQSQKKEAEERFKEISEAYAVLCDPEKRSLYDSYGQSGIHKRYGSSEEIFREADFASIFEELASFGFEGDLFEHLFKGLGAGFGPSRSKGKRFHFTVPEESMPEESVSGGASSSKKETLRVEISVAKAILGGAIRVPTFDGSVTMKIPAGTQSGTLFRLKGKGGFSARGNVRDLIVKVDVRIPSLLSPEQRRLIQAFAKISGEDLEAYRE
ncbi:MAG: DnaJ domain-containing protein [Anaerolineae bacterium]